MSNFGRANRATYGNREIVVHAMGRDYLTGAPGTACGRWADGNVVVSEIEKDCTCRRCLASLAKRDREFRTKARAQLARTWWVAASGNRYMGWSFDDAVWVHTPRYLADAAIAREEGRP